MKNNLFRIMILFLVTFCLLPVYTQAEKKIPEMNLQHSDTRLATGHPALNFRYQDINGKWVSLKDLRGKYVYIDVWATWCGPCCREIPFLKSLEKEMKKKKIVFVSISCDQSKTNWENYVRKEGLGGIQLFKGKAKDLDDFYSIKAIPRFILIDKKGNIVHADMTRPSDPATKESLLKLKGI